jgi:hypothetical protein
MADYAISNVPRRVVYANTGVGPYAFTFEVLVATDIAVYRGSTLLTLTTDYTVSINTNGTGSVTLVTAGTGNITIVGARAIQRTSDYTTGGDLFASTLNTDLDSQTIYAQQVAETAERALKAPVVDPTDINMTLPAKATRAGTVLAFDSPSGNPVAGPSIASVGTVLGNIANINTVATNIASVNTVATNITNVNTVAGISGNVTTVAGISANVTSVAGNATNINTVAGSIANVNTTATNIASVNTVAGELGAGQDVTVVAADLTGDDDIGTVAGSIADINILAPIAADISTVAGIDSDVTAVAADATDIGTVASNITNVNTVAGIDTEITTVAGIDTEVTTVAGIDTEVTTVSGIAANVTTVAGISSNVTTVAGISSDVTTVATNVADITNYSDTYLGAKTTDPTVRNDSSALQAGDLYFNTADDVMKVYSGSAWQAAYVSLSGALIAVNNLSDLTNTSAARQNLDLEIGVDVQAYDAQLTDVAGLSPSDNNFIVGNGTNFVTESGSTARSSLGLGTIATQDSNNVTITGGSVSGITDLAVADGGTGASDASGARTNLGLAIGTNVQAYSAELQGATQGGIYGMKNRIINGAMVIDQRNAGAAVTASGAFPVDRFFVQNSTDGAFSAQQDSSTPVGFVNSLKFTTTTADGSLAATQFSRAVQRIEGFNCADLNWGTANAKTVTLSFWVRSSLTGTFGGALSNSAFNRSYPFTYTISVADTWEQKSVTIAGDTTGTWLTTTGIGIEVNFGLGVGTTYSGTAGAWAGAGYLSATGATSVVGTNGATFYITGVQLEVGSTATSFDYRPYGTELALCQRYYYKIAEGGSAYTQFGAGRAFSGTEGNGIVPFPVPMRSAPTFAYLGAVGDYDFSPTAITGGAVPASNTHMTVGMTFSSITSGSMFWLGANAGASGPAGFTFSAEL